MNANKPSNKQQTLLGRTLSVGIGTTLSGRYASIGREMKQAVELAVEEMNAAGGILGATVSTPVMDDESSTEKGEAVARNFCAHPEVLGVVGHYSSDISVVASNVYQYCDLPMITPIASNPAVTDRGLPNVFRFTNRDDNTGSAIAGYLYRTLGKRRAVVVESQYAYGKSMTQCFERAFLQLGGEIVARRTVSVGERDFVPLIALLPKDFDLLFYGGAFEGALLLIAMRSAGLRQLFAAGDGCWDVTNFLQPAKGAATEGEGVLVLSATPAPGRAAGSLEFANRYIQRYGPIIKRDQLLRLGPVLDARD